MKQINLTQNQITLVDNEDYVYLNQWKWQAYWNKNTQSYYAIRTERKNNKKKTIYLHRQINNTPDNLVCDHINHDTLNNQKNNLRNVTDSQNSRNRIKARKDNKSTGVLGVQYREGRGFCARIQTPSGRKQFPYRNNLDDAILDRKQAELVYYGDYRGESNE